METLRNKKGNDAKNNKLISSLADYLCAKNQKNSNNALIGLFLTVNKVIDYSLLSLREKELVHVRLQNNTKKLEALIEKERNSFNFRLINKRRRR